MHKFEQRHNKAQHNRRVSRFLRKFHRDGMRYNTSKKREFDEFDGDFFWHERGEWADLNHEDFEAHSYDYKINRRCFQFTGIRTQ